MVAIWITIAIILLLFAAFLSYRYYLYKKSIKELDKQIEEEKIKLKKLRKEQFDSIVDAQIEIAKDPNEDSNYEEK